MSEGHGRRGATDSDDYSAVYYHDYSGPPYTYDEPHWKEFFGRIADRVIALFEPGSVYDAGCAKGFMVRAFAERGVQAFGGDISAFAIADAPPDLAQRLEVKDLTEPFDRRFDVITCVEVLEHMAPADAQQAVENMCRATDVVVLSTTPDDFAEPTHVNIRPPASWAQDFGQQGFFRRTDVDASFLSPWAVVYQRQQLTALQAVARYETLLQPLLREVQDKRQALLDLRRQLDEAADPVMRERDRLLAEIQALTADRDHTVDQRVALAAELERFRGSDTLLAQLAVVDELMGAKAQLHQSRVRAETAIQSSGREAERLRKMLKAANEEIAVVKAEAGQALRESEMRTEQAQELARLAVSDRDRDVQQIRSSMSWKIGQAVLLPVRLARRARTHRAPSLE